MHVAVEFSGKRSVAAFGFANLRPTLERLFLGISPKRLNATPRAYEPAICWRKAPQLLYYPACCLLGSLARKRIALDKLKPNAGQLVFLGWLYQIAGIYRVANIVE